MTHRGCDLGVAFGAVGAGRAGVPIPSQLSQPPLFSPYQSLSLLELKWIPERSIPSIPWPRAHNAGSCSCASGSAGGGLGFSLFRWPPARQSKARGCREGPLALLSLSQLSLAEISQSGSSKAQEAERGLSARGRVKRSAVRAPQEGTDGFLIRHPPAPGCGGCA